MRELVVLEHTEDAGASAFTQVLDSRTSIAPWRRIDVPAGQSLPTALHELAGILVMGGEMSAVDPARHDWMIPEIALLERAVTADVPVFGVCLGAQLLGTALGGQVGRRDVPEVDYIELTRTTAGRGHEVIAGWPDGAANLFLHEDEVLTLPPGADSLLRGSDGTACWRLGSALALQSHPEVTAAQLMRWVDQEPVTGLLERAGTDATALIDEAHRRERMAVPLGRALIGRWIDGPVRHRADAAPGVD